MVVRERERLKRRVGGDLRGKGGGGEESLEHVND